MHSCIKCCGADSLNPDPDPAFHVNLDTDTDPIPDPGFLTKNIKEIPVTAENIS